jgi:tRNA nucleotidyltransferase/poly(A) polymerase
MSENPTQWDVGGFVRDSLLGIQSKDRDIMVDLPTYEALEAWAAGHLTKVYERRPEMLILRGHGPHGPVDYNLPRTESAYSDNRSPDSVQVGTFEEDMARRDFTCNAIARNIATGELIDLHGGVQDINNRHLRMVGDAHERLAEDHLRIVRAIRFCITKRFSPVGQLEEILMDGSYANKLQTLPVERIRDEMWKALSTNTAGTLRFLAEIHPAYTEAIFDRGLWLLPTTASNRRPPQ